MTFTAAQQIEWERGPPIVPSGDQTQAQAENLRLDDFARVCELLGLFPLPSDDDMRAAIEADKLKLTSVSYNQDVAFTYWTLDGQYMRQWEGEPGKGPGTLLSFWDGKKWTGDWPFPSENELARFTQVFPPLPEPIPS